MRQKPVASAPCGLVQVIHLQWDRSARGDQGDRDRGAVPLAFAVPARRLHDAGKHLHVEELRWGHHDDFSEPSATRRLRVPLEDEYRFGCVAVSAHPEGLLVRYEHECHVVGKAGPADRPPVVREALARAGQWVRVRYNGRFVCPDFGTLWYEQATINVAWFDGEPCGDIFTNRKPAHEILEMVALRETPAGL